MLQEIADITRNVLEDYLKVNKVSISTDFPYRGDFPIDCCKGTSFILGFVMSETLNMNNVYYTNGKDSEGFHGWVEYNSKIIDITIDQFDFKNNTLVIDIEKSNFHSRFLTQKKIPFSEIILPSYHNFRKIYNEIKSEIDTKLKRKSWNN